MELKDEPPAQRKRALAPVEDERLGATRRATLGRRDSSALIRSPTLWTNPSQAAGVSPPSRWI